MTQQRTTNLAGVHASGAIVANAFVPRVIVTATEVNLVAWGTKDGVVWYEIARRAGGASLYQSALALHNGAWNWLTGLILDGRVK